MIKFSMVPTGVRYDATIKADAEIPFLGLAIQTGIEIFFGMGVWKFCMSRKRESNGDCTILGEAMSGPKPLRYSNLTNMGTLFKDRYIPKQLADRWVPNDAGVGHSQHGDGMQRTPKLKSKSKNQTLIEVPEIRPDIAMNFLAYGMADNIVGFYFKGATVCQVQVSQRLIQTYFDTGLSAEEMRQEATTEVNYPPNLKIRELM